MSKRNVLVAATCLVLLGLGFAFRGALDFTAPPAQPNPLASTKSPRGPQEAFATGGTREVELPGGGRRDLSQPPGKLLVLHFWATWCPPCVEELPSLLAYWKELKTDKRVELLAVSVDDDWKTVTGWLEKRKAADLPLALDPKHQTAHRFGTDKFPETYVLAPDGKIVDHFLGPVDWSNAAVRKRIAELRGRS